MVKVILHSCCATCLAGVIEQLSKTPSRVERKNKYNITCYFYNPNVHPKKEYDKRLTEVKQYLKKLNIPLIQGRYDKDEWLKAAKGLENELEAGFTHRSPARLRGEGGQRCVKCYTMRLEKTAQMAKNKGFNLFASTLTISPHKKAEIINPIGQMLARKYRVKFLASDFKKRDGFKRACDIARQEEFYRQNYCGCILSKNMI